MPKIQVTYLTNGTFWTGSLTKKAMKVSKKLAEKHSLTTLMARTFWQFCGVSISHRSLSCQLIILSLGHFLVIIL